MIEASAPVSATFTAASFRGCRRAVGRLASLGALGDGASTGHRDVALGSAA